jgi:hypothetical protein
MYEYLNQHPFILRCKTRETHYFDWSNNRRIGEENVQGHRVYYAQAYTEISMMRKNASLCTGESTPTYIFYR